MDLLETKDSAYPNDAVRDQLITRVEAPSGCSLGHFEVEHCPDGLILRGRARRYYDKQMAQVVAVQMFGLRILANDIEVV